MNFVYELPHKSPKDFKLHPHGIFAAGGAYVPTQEKKKTSDLRNSKNIRKNTQKKISKSWSLITLNKSSFLGIIFIKII